MPALGVIGYHPAELPKNRGRHPLIWALVLGLKKTVIIGHGISNEIAIKNMISLTKDVVEADLSTKIKETLN